MGAWTYTLGDLFARNARLHGARTAMVCGDRRITFAELEASANQVARALGRLGVGRGDRVAILAHNCHTYFEVYGGAAKLGAISVPLNWRLSPGELGSIVEDAEPMLLIAGGELAETAESIAAERPGILLIVTPGDEDGKHPALGPLMRGAPADPPAVDVEPDDVFALVYTAAVEGTPRGAMLSHANVLAANLQLISSLHLDREDVHLNTLPLFHVTDLGLALAVFHAAGGNVMLPRFDAARALDAVERERATVFGEFAPMLERLVEEQRRRPRDVSSLRHVTGLDRPEVIQEAQAVLGMTYWVAFGQTETAGLVTLAPFGERPGLSGREGSLARVQIVDEAGRECGPGEVGEIVVRGPMVFRGYWRQPEASARTMPRGWHHTGDLGFLDEDGYLGYVGRKAEKALIKPGGENVYPVEVERVILEHPDVREVAVIGVPDAEWGEAVKAVCVARQGAAVAMDDIVQLVRGRIASYKKPKYVQFVAALPRTSDGRVDRGQVKSLYGTPSA